MAIIPKIIHYVWVGGDIPERVRSLIAHNKIFTAEYEVKIWTEQNLPRLNRFALAAYRNKKWAFVADYVRFVALYKYGGIYLDTDQKLLKSIDGLRELEFFAGWNRSKTYIYTGIIGCVPKSDIINTVLEEYENIEFSLTQTSPAVLTRCFYDQKDSPLIKIFPSSYFYPVEIGEKESGRILVHTYSTHLWDESWVPFVRLRRFLRRIGVIRLYHILKGIRVRLRY